MTSDVRKHPRAPFKNSLVAHNNQKVYNGICHDISPIGFSFTTQKDNLFLTDSKIIVHFKPNTNIPSFNAQCEVLSVQQLVSTKNPNAKLLFYRIKFVQVPAHIIEAIHQYATRHPSSTAA